MKKVVPIARGVAPVVIGIGVFSINAFAASPVAQMFQNVSNEATSAWAVAGSVAAFVIGALGIAFGSHDIKGVATKMLIGSSVALGAQATITALG